MTVYPNPFESRASEQQRDLRQFVRTFGPGAIDLLPNTAWDRLVVFRSSPGAGKTSLMRLFSAEALLWAVDQVDQSDALRRVLVDRDVLAADGQLKKLGVLISLDRDYRALVDLPFEPAAQTRLFLRLVDSRVMTGVIRAALATSGHKYPQDVDLFSLDASTAETKTQAAVERMGGPGGTGLITHARETEQSMLALLDEVLASEMNTHLEGHSELLCLDVLEQCSLAVAGQPVELQPLLMFDDGHELGSAQREALLDNLRRRRPKIARWYAERFEALSNQELLQGLGSGGRDYVEVDIDEVARNGSGRQFTSTQHNKILSYIALARSAPVLNAYARESQPFFDLLDEPADEPLGPTADEIIETLRRRTIALAGGDSRYSQWLHDAEQLSDRRAANRWRELEILISRDQKRQHELFSEPLSMDELAGRSSSAVREAAILSVSSEFGLPYYGGESGLLALGSHNAEQFLNLCGVLFEDLMLDVSLGRKAHLSAQRQDRLLRKASEQYWESISRTVPNGRDVRAVVAEIVRIAVGENSKPTVPYPPGVTGTALLMSERERLLDVEYRNSTPGADRLFNALASAVAYNVVTADLDYAVKGDRYMVLYLNRLLCPRFGLPLGRGSFRERPLQKMLSWVQNLPASGYRDPSSFDRPDLRLDL